MRVAQGVLGHHAGPLGEAEQRNALALMRYGLLGGNSSGLHDIWGMSNATAMAALSIAVVAAFAAVMTFVAMRVFRRAAVQ